MHDRSALAPQHRTASSTSRVVKRLIVVLIVSSLGTAAVGDSVASGSQHSAAPSSDVARAHRPKTRAVELPKMLPPMVPPVQMPNLIPPEHDPVSLPQATPAGANRPTPETRP